MVVVFNGVLCVIWVVGSLFLAFWRGSFLDCCELQEL